MKYVPWDTYVSSDQLTLHLSSAVRVLFLFLDSLHPGVIVMNLVSLTLHLNDGHIDRLNVNLLTIYDRNKL